MTKHTLGAGSQLVSAVLELGRALGYDAVDEFPVEVRKRNPQAIDVVWKHDQDQRYPLMVFEIESRTTNAAANNPLKLFSKRKFEKPLFFFHLFAEAGRDSTRLDDLQEEYGKLNYRVYSLSQVGIDVFLKDVLSQHRRLTSQLEIIPLVRSLRHEAFHGADLHNLLAHVEELGFNRRRGITLPAYASLAADAPEFSQDFFRYLTGRMAGKIAREDDRYETYFGEYWTSPLHYAILSCMQADPAMPVYFDRYRRWHEEPGVPALLIGPMFGLNMEHDHFLAYFAAPFSALLGLLMKDVTGAVAYLAQQLESVLNEIRLDMVPVWSHLSSWVLHLCASESGGEELFERVRRLVNDRGGIARRFLFQPYGGVPFAHQNAEMAEAFLLDRVEVPEVGEFRLGCATTALEPTERRKQAVRLGMRGLADPDLTTYWDHEIIRLLHSDPDRRRKCQ